MSSRQRKRPGGAIDSRPARKRSRLLPSSAGGTSQTEPRDLEESATPAFEPAGGEFLDLTGDSSELGVIAISIDESPVDSQQSQQQPHLSRASENSAEPLARNDEEEPREDDGAWPAGPASPPMREGDNSQVQDKDQSQQYPLGSRDTENSVELRASDSEEEPRDSNEYVTDEESLQSAISDTSAWTARLVSPPTCEDDNAESQQDPLDSRAAENAAEVLANESEEEPQDTESSALSSDWLLFDFDLPYWSAEDSEAREQNQQHSHFSRSAENSAGPLTAHDEEEPKDNDCAWPAGPASPPMREGGNSQVQDREQSQQYPLGSREAENSAELRASDSEEEPRYNDDSINSDEWPDRFESPPTWQDDITDDWEESQQYPLHSRSAENSLELLASNLQQEPRDIEFEPPRGFISPPNWEDDNAELLEVHGQERRNVTLNSQEQVAGSGNGAGANDVPVADLAPAEQGAEEEDTESSDAQQGVVIRCPICMEYYAEFVRRGRQLVAALCGHVFCSRCLPIALEASHMCPVCRMYLDPELYHHIYL